MTEKIAFMSGGMKRWEKFREGRKRKGDIMRQLMWVLITIITLGILSYEVTYVDGLHLKFIGWPERLSNWRKNRKSK